MIESLTKKYDYMIFLFFSVYFIDIDSKRALMKICKQLQTARCRGYIKTFFCQPTKSNPENFLYHYQHRNY